MKPSHVPPVVPNHGKTLVALRCHTGDGEHQHYRTARSASLDWLDDYLGVSVISFGEMVWRLGLASAFGLLLGIDREARGMSAGIRTHTLVALSSAITMLIALELFEELSARSEGHLDPTRAIQGLAQAIGFLVAGVIWTAKGNVYGLTTAASLWMTSAIGMAAGSGMYKIALVGLVFAFAITTLLWFFKLLLPRTKAAETEDR
jgi:putative Mg2+ transporter-C (MgtC) family protein